MNKKAEEDNPLLKEVGGVLLAITATAIIVFFVYTAIIRITADTELDSAKTLINVLEAKVNALPSGQSMNHTIQGFRAETAAWYIMGWGTSSPEARPDKCFLKSCICICSDHDADACQNRGICRFFEDVEYVQVKGYAQTSQFDSEGLPEIVKGENNYILLPSNLLVVEIKKTENKIELTSDREWQDYLKSLNK